MGPRTYIRGKASSSGRSSDHFCWASMGPRTYIRGKTEPDAQVGAQRPWLQWGRGLTSAERNRHSVIVRIHVPASMGPRTYIRGKGAMHHRRDWQSSGFNGAADLHPRKGRIRESEPLIRGRASMGPRTYIRGKQSPTLAGTSTPLKLQWGRGLTSAEREGKTNLWQQVQVASMGPRTYIRGKQTAVLREAEGGVLASMGPRTYIRGKSGGTTGVQTPPTGFNGAADLHPRKEILSLGMKPITEASMGPRTYIRGKPADKIAFACICHGFNGAADLHPRKVASTLALNDDLKASMGPRTYIRGKGVNPYVSNTTPSHASMGPRTYIRGKRIQDREKDRKLLCFNGAADLHPRKATPAPVYSSPKSSLQWGRGLTSAESGRMGDGVSTLSQLQWGRGLTSAESTFGTKNAGQHLEASMGPRTYIRGKQLVVC